MCREYKILPLSLPPSKLRQNSKVKAVIQTLSLDTSPLKKRNTAELGYSWQDSSKIAVAFAKPVIQNDIYSRHLEVGKL